MNIDDQAPIILTVDDDPANIKFIASHLKNIKPKLLVATSGQEALDVLATQHPDIILLDINMPGMSGIELCQKIKKLPAMQDIPIIFLTGGENDVSEAFLAGGVDYILKPVKSEELLARIHTHIKLNRTLQSLDRANSLLEGANTSLESKVQKRTLELVTANNNLRREIEERRRLQDKLTYLSNYDFVTRMLNRASMELELKSKIDDLTNLGERWYLFYMDIDQFKIVNDTCGHVAGDELLRQIAEILRSLYNEECICARMGGDEFTLLLKADDLEHAIQKANTLKQTIENHKFEWNEDIFRHTISMALVEIDEGVDSVSHLLSIAERTCFESKRKGGGEISIYNHSREYINKAQQQMKVVPIIHQALENNQFRLYFQHIIPMQPDGGEKIEVLIRLKDTIGKIKPPGHFIPIAERFHLITEIDKWVIKNTLHAMQSIPEHIIVSINLSGEFILKSSASNIVKGFIDEFKISPKRLCFEITESSAISNLEATQSFIHNLSQIGCEFALDDFGTGTSSYEYLKELAVDYVKIDGLFIRDIENDPINRKMVESIVAISEAKDVKVIAECVETKPALNIVENLKLDYYQGFYNHIPESITTLFHKK